MTNTPTPRMIAAGRNTLKPGEPIDFCAIYEAMERARTEPERPEGFYWVKHDDSDGKTLLFWYTFEDTEPCSVPLEVLSDRLTPPEPVNATINTPPRPIYINDDTETPYMSDSPKIDWKNVKRWKYATDWKVWNGGPCPVTGRVGVLLRDGTVNRPAKAEVYVWSHTLTGHKEREIVAYKPVT